MHSPQLHPVAPPVGAEPGHSPRPHTPPVRALLSAVRRRLWRWQFVAALRLALWGTAGLMLLAVAVHLTASPVAVDAVLWAPAALWVALLMRAGWQRPTEAACALWADRHLGGASAYGTLFDAGQGSQPVPNLQALRWLEVWAGARVPGSLRRLTEHQAPARLARALLAMGVCTALAALVLTLPDLARVSPRPGAAPSSASAAGASPPVMQAPARDELAREITAALRPATAPDAAARNPRAAAAAGRGRTGDGPSPLPAPTGATPAAEQARSGPVTAGPSAAAAPTATTATGSGSGREAGEGRDAGADDAVSRHTQATIGVQRTAAGAPRLSDARQADMEQVAVYDDTLSMPGAASMSAGHAPAAAAPPAATESAQWSATEASYVQAWLKASPRRR